MRTSEETITELLEAVAGAGDVRARKMFGEYALYCNEKVVALVCRDELFLKDTEAGRMFAPNLELVPAYDGAKPGLRVPRDTWAETEWMSELISRTVDALPAKKK